MSGCAAHGRCSRASRASSAAPSPCASCRRARIWRRRQSWASPISTRAAIEAMPAGCDRGRRCHGRHRCRHLRRHPVRPHGASAASRPWSPTAWCATLAGVRGTGLPVWCSGAAAPPSVAGLTFVGWQEPIGCGGVAVFPDDRGRGRRRRRRPDPGRLARRCAGRGRRAGAHGGVDHGRGRAGRRAARPLPA